MARRIRPPLVVLLAVILLSVAVSALTGRPAAATTTQCGATATADSYVKQSPGASSNFGTADPLEVQGTATTARWSYLKFTCALPAEETVGSAVLRVRFIKVQTQPVEVHSAPNTWTETGITWNNKPATTGLLTSRTVALGFVDFTVSGIVDGDNTLVLKAPTSTSNYQFRSHNPTIPVGDRPTLTVTTTPPPTTTEAPTTTTEAPTTTVAPTTTTAPPPPPPGLLDQRLKGTETGAWSGAVTAGTSANVNAKVAAAGSRYRRMAARDCFIGATCGTDNHPGTLDRDTFKAMVASAVANGEAPWVKMLPITYEALDNAPSGNVFCPPWTGDATGMLATYKAVLDAVREVTAGPIIVELNNEMDVSCTRTPSSPTNGPWDVQSGTNLGIGSVGVAKRIGEHYAQNAPPLFAYAAGLGFAEVIAGDYIGVGGGPNWSSNPNTFCAADATAEYGYMCPAPGIAWQDRWVREWNTAVHDAYAANPNPYLIPQFEAVHQYWHGPDFDCGSTTQTCTYDGYNFADGIVYAYNRAWITQSRQIVNGIWGASIGDQIRFAISEGNAGVSRSDAWVGWQTPAMVEAFYSGVLANLKGDGNLTGSGTAYWAFTVFCAACNASAPGNKYDIVLPDGSVPAWYDEWATFTP